MPIYEFECSRHGGFTEFASVEGRHSVRCPKCGRLAKKVMSIPAAVISDWPIGGRYVSGAAKYSGDPDGFCPSRSDAIEKIKRRGHEAIVL